jgi:hypothetical protein
MPYKDMLAGVDFALQRDSAFSRQCGSCSRCCHEIGAGPDIVFYLARRLDRRVGFWDYFGDGAPPTIITLAIGTVWLWL